MTSSIVTKVVAGVVAVAVLLALGVAVLTAVAVGAGSMAAASTGAGELRTDAPVPAPYRSAVVAAGHLCPLVTPAAIAAQIEVESGWNPNAYTDSGAVPAIGIAQFTTATWARWGADFDRDGQSGPTDPQDAIIAAGHLMCDLVRWARDHRGELTGEPLELAWAAYHGGRELVRESGGVPPAASAPLTHAYPKKVRDRIAKYADVALAAGAVGWTLPLPPGHRVTSTFGPRCMRTAAGTLRCRNHNGIDLGAGAGTPVFAAAAGVVVAAGCDSAYCDRPGYVGLGGCGFRVSIQHAGNLGTMYCHLRQLNVVAGQRVVAGQAIGWVGSTGDSSGPHLHFQVHRAPPFSGATAIDPLSLLHSVGLVFG
ncbi:MAG TPA: peptidoglycan DD-metalloendopeptidase family protein [Micromonosporaceae bacterium]